MKPTNFFRQLLPVSLILLLLGLLPTGLHSQAYKVRMAMIGNSITYGSGLSNPAANCYPTQLSNLLETIYGDTVEIQNYGVSGRTMLRATDKAIWDESEFKDALEFVPDICLILLGTNDSQPQYWDPYGANFLTDYLTMIDTFQFRNPDTRFLLCYPPPAFEQNTFGMDNTVIEEEIMPLIDSVVAYAGATLVDFHNPLLDSIHLFPDYIHPNVEGAGVLAQMLFDLMVDIDIVHQVDAGLAFVSTFEQETLPAPEGGPVELSWSTIFADSVFLDGVPVDLSGNTEVIAVTNQTYTLTAKGPQNQSSYPLVLETYIPEISGLDILKSSSAHEQGDSVTLYSVYVDQFGMELDAPTQAVSWSVVQGNAAFGTQTDTSIVFIPTETGQIIVEAQEGPWTAQRYLWVFSLTDTKDHRLPAEAIQVFPNPVREHLNIALDQVQGESLQVSIYNVEGRIVKSEQFKSAGRTKINLEIDTGDLPNGSYFFAIQIGEQYAIGQFTKA